MNVIIIDDDKAMLLYVQAFFVEAGHETILADCAETALKLFTQHSFDMIVTDIMMPGLNGFQFINKVRELTNEYIPVIYMTASEENTELHEGISAGDGIYLPKPIKPIVLQSYINVMEQLTNANKVLSIKAKFDTLTELPNRALLRDRLNMSIKRAKRNKTKIALLFIDLDHFKSINDLMGHEAGDKVLIETARRLLSCVRDSDTVCRLGGDEFIIMLPDLEHSNSLNLIIDKILTTLNLPFMHDDKETPAISGSLGVSMFPDDATDIDGLLNASDTAMYKAKKDGRNNFYHYNQELGDSISKHNLIGKELNSAIKEQQLEVYYQPQLTCDTYQLSGMEALLRWNHPKLGYVPPDEFIIIAEETGQISNIGLWVLESVCSQIKLWEKQGFDLPRISINLSAIQIKNERLADDIIDVIKKQNVNFDTLAFEITESCVIDNPDKTISFLTRLRNLGLKISMDDFGTGYSSLSYLNKLPLDQLKIDREFIPDEDNDNTITNSIITLGHSLGLNVIAEGVETSEQFKYLKERQCDEIQGYFFSKPKAVNEISSMLKDSSGSSEEPILKSA